MQDIKPAQPKETPQPPTTPEVDGPRPAVGPDDTIPFEGQPNG